MKTRNIATRFWRDSYISNLSSNEKLSLLYFLTNEQVNLCGIYEIPDKYIMLDLDFSSAELKKTKKILQKDRRVLFYKNWIYIVNYAKYNKYNPLPNVIKKFKEEFNSVPVGIKKHFFSLADYIFPLNINRENIKFDKDTVTVIDIVIDIRLGGRVGGRLGRNDETVDIDGIIKELDKNKKSS